MGLVDCALLNQGAGLSAVPNLARRAVGAITGGVWAANGGVRLTTNTDKIEFATPAVSLAPGVTYAVYGDRFSTPTNNARAIMYGPDRSNGALVDNIGTVKLVMNNLTVGAPTTIILPPDVPDVLLAVTCTVGGQTVSFLNGRWDVGTSGMGALPSLVAGFFRIGVDDASENLPGTYHMACVWNRALTVPELQWLQVEPYAFITPPGPPILYFDLGASSIPSPPAPMTSRRFTLRDGVF